MEFWKLLNLFPLSYTICFVSLKYKKSILVLKFLQPVSNVSDQILSMSYIVCWKDLNK